MPGFISPQVHTFQASPSDDVVTHRLRIIDAGQEPSYSMPAIDVGTSGSFDLAQIYAGQDVDGVFDLALTAVDHVGNESSFVIKRDVPLDLVPPLPPAWL